MSGAKADRLAGWRAARAALSVATVATTFSGVATRPEAQKSAVVTTVATVASGYVQSGNVAADFENLATTDDLKYLAALAGRRWKAIREGRAVWTRPDVLAAMRGRGIDPGEDEVQS